MATSAKKAVTARQRAARLLFAAAVTTAVAVLTSGAAARSKLDAPDATTIELAANPNVIALGQTVTLSGRLGEGDPNIAEAIIGGTVSVKGYIDANCSQGERAIADVTTDSAGTYSATDTPATLPPVSYRVFYAGGIAGGPPTGDDFDGDEDQWLPSTSPCVTVVSGRPLSAQAEGDVLVDNAPFKGGVIDYGATVDLKPGAKVKVSSNVGRVAIFTANSEAAFVASRVLTYGPPRPGAKPRWNSTVILRLVGGDFSQCKQTKGARSTSAKKPPPKRNLWANSKGHYRTKGRYSAATTLGTYWLTQETCDGTLTKVKRGVVQVKDLVKNKTVLVTAGHSYLAQAPR